MKNHLLFTDKRGIVLLNTLVVMACFSTIFTFLIKKSSLELSQRRYLILAQERSEIEQLIVSCVVDEECFDVSYELHNSQIEIYYLDTEVTVDVVGKHNFTILMELNLDNFTIISYNYDD